MSSKLDMPQIIKAVYDEESNSLRISGGGGGGGVESLNDLTGEVNIVAGDNITLDVDDNDITINSAGGSSFSDAEFEVYNEIDPTKQIKFDASEVPTETTATIHVPDVSTRLIKTRLEEEGSIFKTAIEEDLVFGNPVISLGSTNNALYRLFMRSSGYIDFGNGDLVLKPDAGSEGTSNPDRPPSGGAMFNAIMSLNTTSRPFYLFHRNAGQSINFETANTENDASGDIIFRTGVPTGTGNRGKIKLQSFLMNLPQSATDPSNPEEADCYYNTTDKKIKFFNGTTWETITSA